MGRGRRNGLQAPIIAPCPHFTPTIMTNIVDGAPAASAANTAALCSSKSQDTDAARGTFHAAQYFGSADRDMVFERGICEPGS